MNASRDNNEGNGDCSDAFDFLALFFVFFVSGEFLAADNETASKKLVRIKSQPAFLIAWLRDFADDFSGLFTLSILAYF